MKSLGQKRHCSHSHDPRHTMSRNQQPASFYFPILQLPRRQWSNLLISTKATTSKSAGAEASRNCLRCSFRTLISSFSTWQWTCAAPPSLCCSSVRPGAESSKLRFLALAAKDFLGHSWDHGRVFRNLVQEFGTCVAKSALSAASWRMPSSFAQSSAWNSTCQKFEGGSYTGANYTLAATPWLVCFRSFREKMDELLVSTRCQSADGNLSQMAWLRVLNDAIQQALIGHTQNGVKNWPRRVIWWDHVVNSTITSIYGWFIPPILMFQFRSHKCSVLQATQK